jgi:hypothetical protein
LAKAQLYPPNHEPTIGNGKPKPLMNTNTQNTVMPMASSTVAPQGSAQPNEEEFWWRAADTKTLLN